MLPTLVFALLLALVTWVASASAATPQDDAFGVNVQTLMNWAAYWGPSMPPPWDPTTDPAAPPWDPYLSALAADGVGEARNDAPWYWVQPSQSSQLSDSSNWLQMDTVVTALASNHLRWQPVIDLAPPWAAQTPYTPSGCAPVETRYLPPADPAQYAAFAGAIAARYGPGGTFWADNPTLPYLPVTRYEIWNEPNVDAYWNNAPSATQYVTMYNDARAAIDAADPTAQVLVGGIVWGGEVNCVASVTNDASYIEGLFAAGGSGWQPDGIAVHPYGPAVLNIVANLRREQQALQAAGATNVPLEQTELGWPVAPTDAPAGSLAAGYQSDASRGGTLALATDVVMGSDCDVQSFDAYTAVEREDTTVDEDPAGVSPFDLVEHWMGIFALGATEGEQAPPTLTSEAFGAAIARDLAGDNAAQNIAVCAPSGTAGQLLPLALALAPTTQAGCFNATVTYYGLPVYGAELSATTPIEPAGTTSFGPAFTDQNGVVGFCVGTGANATVVADVGGGSFDPDLVPLVAQSNPVGAQGPPGPAAGTTTTSSSTGAGGSTATGTTSTSATTTTSISIGAGASSATGTSATSSANGEGASTSTGTSGSTTITSTTTAATSVTQTPVVSPAPACVLHSLRPSGQRLDAVVQHGLRMLVDLATLDGRHGCQLSLTLRLHGVTVGSARALLTRIGVTTVTVRLNKTGRRDLRRPRAMTVTLHADLANATAGLGTLTESVRLRAS